MNKLPAQQEMNMTQQPQTVDQSRAATEVQSAMIVAQKFPRDEMQAYSKIMSACERPSLAERALYAYKRGTTLISGPSIRLAEVMARCYKNIDYGFRETARGKISSEVEAYCWDMENNVRARRVFTVKHWRDTNNGGYPLTSERDIYELVANQAQRRVRACILEMIPGDMVEEAVAKCNETMSKMGGDKPIEDQARQMVVEFKKLGVTQGMIEKFLDHTLDAIIPSELVNLRNIFKSIRDGIAPREDFFEVNEKKKTTTKEKLAKKEKPNPLHKTPEWADWMETRNMFPDEASGLPDPSNTDDCLRAVAAVKEIVDKQN